MEAALFSFLILYYRLLLVFQWCFWSFPLDSIQALEHSLVGRCLKPFKVNNHQLLLISKFFYSTENIVYLGVGIAMNFSNAYVCIYYNLIIAYALYYLVLSFTSNLPWAKCNPSWASVSK